MWKFLHAHLRDGMDFSSEPPDAQDCLEPLSNETSDLEERAAKRQRLETIAIRYLRGQPPVIASAGLALTHNRALKNARRLYQLEKDRDASETVMVGGTAHIGQKRKTRSQAKGTGLTQGGVTKRTGPTRRSPRFCANQQQDSSRGREIPETREPIREDAMEEGATEDTFEAQGATMPSGLQRKPTRTKRSAAQSACKKLRQSPRQKNQQWLRRRRTDGEGETTDTQRSLQQQPSPLRTSNNESPVTAASQVAPQHAPPSPTRLIANTAIHVPPNEPQSSASASMVISSPVKRPATMTQKKPARMSNAQEEDTTAVEQPATPSITTETITSATSLQRRLSPYDDDNLLQETKPMPVQVRYADEYARDWTTVFRHNTPRVITVQHPAVDPYGLSPMQIIEPQPSPATSTTKRRSVSREEVLQHAERCAVVASPAVKPYSKRKRPSHIDLEDDGQMSWPASAASFKYRRITKSKGQREVGTAKYIQSGEPQSPRLDTLDGAAERTRGQTIGTSGRAMELDGRKVTSETSSAQVDRRESASSTRQSLYSTQAAFMMAQRDFQDGTMPPATCSTPIAPPSVHDDSTRPFLSQPSPVITPFHAFNAGMAKCCLKEGAAEEMLLSTQELFSAASPFTFSEIKRKPVAPKRSSLRFSIPSNTANTEEGIKSPTPSGERVPLKEREVRPLSFHNTHSQERLQKSPVPSPTRLAKEKGLPQLSLPSLGGSIDFTNRFMAQVEEGMAQGS